MKQKPDLILFILGGVIVGIIVSWIYLLATKNMEDFKPKVEDVNPITINFLYWIGDSDVNHTCKPTSKS